MNSSALNTRIEQLFGSRPRDGTEDGVLWHRRAKLETRLSQLLSARSQNICVDGPTGSGKSSLAITVLSKIRQPYVWVPVVSDMQWPDFCEDIILRSLRTVLLSRPHGGAGTVKLQLDAKSSLTAEEIINPLKLLKRISIDVADSLKAEGVLREQARTWKLGDVENFLEENGFSLLIDDFEKAPDELVQTIADLCKRMTIRSAPKCVIVGTGETFARLYRADEGLDGRLAELSVASFGSEIEVWNYLNDGFELLGFDTPRAMLKSKLISKHDAGRVQTAFYEAADGMPKYINELAMRICERVLGESYSAPTPKVRVSVSEALREAAQMLDENLSRCAHKVRRVEKHLRISVELRLVLRAIFQLGANGVHRVTDLAAFIEQSEDSAFSYDQFVSGFEQLRMLDLYVQTGKSGEVVFAKDPMFAHILGLICNDPPRYRKDNSVFGLFGQRTLPLFGT